MTLEALRVDVLRCRFCGGIRLSDPSWQASGRQPVCPCGGVRGLQRVGAGFIPLSPLPGTSGAPGDDPGIDQEGGDPPQLEIDQV